MNYFIDLIILASVCFISYSSYKRGFSKVLIGVVVIFLSFIVLLKFHDGLYNFFGRFFTEQLNIQIASFIFIFTILLIIAGLTGKLFKVLPEDITDIFQHLFSAIAGFTKGILYVGLLLVVLAHFIEPVRTAADESLIGSKLAKFIKDIIQMLSKVAK